MHLSNLFESFDRLKYSYEEAGPEYSVPELYKYAQKSMALISLPTETLVHNIKKEEDELPDELDNFTGTPAFRRKAIRSDLAQPILVHKIDNKYWAIDGSSRIMKADEFKKKYMKAYVFVGNLPARTQIK